MAPPALKYPVAELPLLCLVGAGAASFWRGTWFMMDAALWPDAPLRSCTASAIGGFGGFAALHQGAAARASPHSGARGRERVSRTHATVALRKHAPRHACSRTSPRHSILHTTL